jgi:uncharacterized protein YcaQ
MGATSERFARTSVAPVSEARIPPRSSVSTRREAPALWTGKAHAISQAEGRRIWLRAQGLDRCDPFGTGPEATPRAVAHLGYVQIDTINVVERCHHHILYSRIPDYRRAHLHQAQTVDKTVFEYWTHALAYVPSGDFRYFVPTMRAYRRDPGPWFRTVRPADLRKVLRRIREIGPLSIRDIDDDELVDKDHAWASRKPSRRALQLAFFRGILTVRARAGMLKTYDLIERHFGWEAPPKAATEREITEYKLERALRAQGIVSLNSACYMDAPRKPAMQRLIDARVRRGLLVPLAVEGAGKTIHWATPDAIEVQRETQPDLVHILSPFDPLVIQRKRLALFFGYTHRFEAYVPKHKRVFGYFALPVLVGDRVVAAIDLKTDRAKGKLLLQQWTWLNGADRSGKPRIEDELHRFERFQLAGAE